MLLTDDEKQQLRDIAKHAIQYGLQHRLQRYTPRTNNYTGTLILNNASFVTLHIDEQLRGCIGSLEAIEPLIQDVAHNANSAAFTDRRFTPLTIQEFEQIAIEISVLSAAEPIVFTSEQDLLDQVVPGKDGLVLMAGSHQSTFLPVVWEQLPQPRQFLLHLKRKAQLADDYWSDTIKVSRYSTTTF